MLFSKIWRTTFRTLSLPFCGFPAQKDCTFYVTINFALASGLNTLWNVVFSKLKEDSFLFLGILPAGRNDRGQGNLRW